MQHCDCAEALQHKIHCCECQKFITWPRWVRTEPCHYDSLCWDCYATLDQHFTPEAAICQARIIVGVHQRVTR